MYIPCFFLVYAVRILSLVRKRLSVFKLFNTLKNKLENYYDKQAIFWWNFGSKLANGLEQYEICEFQHNLFCFPCFLT